MKRPGLSIPDTIWGLIRRSGRRLLKATNMVKRHQPASITMILAVPLILSLVTNTLGQTGDTNGQAPVELDPVIVTGSITPMPISQTPASVTVITREQIDESHQSSVTELLRQVPGLHIDQPSARGSVSSVYIRGGDPNFTVVLIDGVQVNDPTNNRGGSFDFSTLSTDSIERIEVVRGPLSAIYGSDAMAGVINIITRQGGADTVYGADAAGGRFGYIRSLLEANGMLGVMDYAVSGSYLDIGEPVEGNKFTGKTYYLNFGVPVADNMELRWMLRYADSKAEAFPEDSGGPELAVLRDLEERDIDELTLGFTFMHEPLSWWSYRFKVGIYDRQEDIDSPGVAPGIGGFVPPNVTDNTYRRYDVTLRHFLSPIKSLRIALGAQAQFEAGNSRATLELDGFLLPTSFDLSRDTWAPFFEVQFSPLAGLLLQGGVRVDLPQGFDSKVSPRIGLSYTIAATNTILRASWGEGFKLPSFFALGNPIVGDPALVPETSTSVEAGITQTLWTKRITVSATYFYNEFDDLIDFDVDLFRLVNRQEVTTQGVEMSFQLRPWSALEFASHLTYVKTDIKGSTDDLLNRPKWRGGFTVNWRPVSVFNVNLRTLVVGEMLDSSIPTGVKELDAFARVDLAMTWDVTLNWQLFLTVDNLFNANDEEAIGFPGPGINPRGGVRARF